MAPNVDTLADKAKVLWFDAAIKTHTHGHFITSTEIPNQIQEFPFFSEVFLGKIKLPFCNV